MSAAESAMASPSMSAAASAEVSMSCADAWDAVDTTSINSISDLEAVASDVSQTFSDCQSLDEWLAQAQATLPTLDVQELQTWATAQCSLDDTLSQTPVCMAINS